MAAVLRGRARPGRGRRGLRRVRRGRAPSALLPARWTTWPSSGRSPRRSRWPAPGSGYVLTSPEIVEDVQRVRLPYHLSSLTQAAGEVALRHVGEASTCSTRSGPQRDRIVPTSSRDAGRDRPTPRDANFVLFHPGRPADEVWQGLLERGVLVRDFSTLAGTEGCLRVTAGTPEETDAFLPRPARRCWHEPVRARRARPRRRPRSPSTWSSTGPARPAPTPGSRSSTTCSSSSASTAGSTSPSRAKGDLEIDAHHTVEDIGIAAGPGPGRGPRRQGGDPPVRRRHRPARRGAGRGGPGPVGPGPRGARRAGARPS